MGMDYRSGYFDEAYMRQCMAVNIEQDRRRMEEMERLRIEGARRRRVIEEARYMWGYDAAEELCS